MSDLRADYDWESLRAQFGDLVRLALHRLLNALRDQPVVFFVLVSTAAISYHALFMLASGTDYRPAVWVAILFPLQLDIAGWPGLKVALDSSRPRWQRRVGTFEALVVVLASAFGNIAAVLGFLHGDPRWALVSNIYLAVLSPVMLVLCLVIAHLPGGAPARPVTSGIPGTPATPPDVAAKVAAAFRKEPGMGRRRLRRAVPELSDSRARDIVADRKQVAVLHSPARHAAGGDR